MFIEKDNNCSSTGLQKSFKNLNEDSSFIKPRLMIQTWKSKRKLKARSGIS